VKSHFPFVGAWLLCIKDQVVAVIPNATPHKQKFL
jgi:hypothetical protein